MTEGANPSNSDKLERADFHTLSKRQPGICASARSRSGDSSRGENYQAIGLERHSGSRKKTLMPTPRHDEYILCQENERDRKM